MKKRSFKYYHQSIFIIALLLTTVAAVAQKKVEPITQSPLTGIATPAGTKKDGRGLSVAAAKAILQGQAKKESTSVSNAEVLYFPAGFTMDSLSDRASANGWTFSKTDQQYGWLRKESRSVLVYCDPSKTQTDIYLGESPNGSPANTGNTTPQQDVNNNTNNLGGGQNQTNTDPDSGNNNTNNNNSQAYNPGGYTFTTTNFADGWNSTVYSDYVLTTKGDIKVFLSYVIKYDEKEFLGTGKERRIFMWDTWVAKYFKTEEAKITNSGTFSDFSEDYVEGAAIDKQTGEKRYLALILNVIPYTGKLTLILASAPNAQELRKQFPNADNKWKNDLLPMYGCNKFAVAQSDIVGKWSTSAGGTMNWYSTTTGQNVGATGAVTGDWFEFKSNGTYASEHSGATGWVGTMNTYQQKYKGTFTVTNWSITVDHRWKDATQVCDAWFEALEGGFRILHMTEGPIPRKLFRE